MKDMALEIYNWLSEHYNIVVVEETGKLYYYKNGVFVPFLDTNLKNKIKQFLTDPLDTDEDIQRYSQSLFTQVKLHLHANVISLKEFDNREWEVNCLNGVVDLRNGGFMTHFKYDENPGYRFIQIPVTYEPKAICPNVIKFIDDVFGKDRKSLIIEILGYLLYKSIKLHKAFIFFGEASSGKTTFIELIQKFLGENNFASVSMQNINKRFQKANVRNKLANIYDDLPFQKLKYIQNFKLITTNKELSGEIKQVQDSVKWKNFCKQIYTCNELPEVKENMGDDFWRRIMLIHCTNHFDNGNKDFDIGDKISTDKELSGLLNLIIHQFPKLLERKHFEEEYDNIDTVKGIWQINIHPMKLFLDECCVITENETDYEESDYFRAQLNAFRKSKNAEGISMNMITRRLKDLGVVKKQKSDGNRYYIGIKIVKTIIDKIDSIIIGGKKINEF